MVFKHCVGLDGVEVRCVCVVQALLLLQRLQEDEEEERGQAITQVGQGDGRRKFAHVEEQMKGCGDGAVVEGEGEGGDWDGPMHTFHGFLQVLLRFLSHINTRYTMPKCLYASRRLSSSSSSSSSSLRVVVRRSTLSTSV